jgi:hypothetical protein
VNGFKTIASPPNVISHFQNTTSSVSAAASTVHNLVLVNVIFPPLIMYTFPANGALISTLLHVFFSVALKSDFANDNWIVLFKSSNPSTNTTFTAKIEVSLIANSTSSKLI